MVRTASSFRLRRLGALVTLTCVSLVGLPDRALADESGTAGRVVKVLIHGEGSDVFPSSHGSITVRHGGNKLDQYSWGGTQCPASSMGEAEIAALQMALHFRSRTLLVPRYKAGEVSGTRCLVGFELQAG